MSLFKAPYGVGEGLKCHYVTVCLSESLTAETAQDSQSRQGQVRLRSVCVCLQGKLYSEKADTKGKVRMYLRENSSSISEDSELLVAMCCGVTISVNEYMEHNLNVYL